MRWKPLGSTWMRNRRMNSPASSVIVVYRAGAFDPVILDLERDAPLVDCDQTAVRYGDAVRIARQIGEHGLWTRERALGVDEPALLAERGEERCERLGIGQMRV